MYGGTPVSNVARASAKVRTSATAGLAALALAAAVLLGWSGPAHAQTDIDVEYVTGDLAMADGVTLRYTVVKPTDGVPRPTLFEYSGYDPGTNPDGTYVNRYVVANGHYNYIGVNLRGTGCSGGTFDFFQPQEYADAVEVLEWLDDQPWHDHHVGMIGKSYPGITQLFTAQAADGLVDAEGGPLLDVIAPGHFASNIYRDVARPGGIQNYGFASLWSFVGRPSYEFQSGTEEFAGGDVQCANGTTGEIRGIRFNPFVQLQEHAFDDDLVQERSAERGIASLRIPMLATLSWQDEQLASRGTDLLAQLDDLNAARRLAGESETPWWATLSNGDHSMSRTATENADLTRFFDHFLRGIDNGWDQRPKIDVWWEAGRDGGARAPGWRTALDAWSERQRIADGTLTPTRLHLREGGSLTTDPHAVDEAPTSYAYTPTGGSQGIGNPHYGSPGSGLPHTYLWDQTPPPGTAVHWTSETFADDVTLLGSASLDLWLASTAVDTDLQVTITEVRPDGSGGFDEVYVQKGWLRLSQRALDDERSTALRPYQTHQEADVALLSPGTAVPARVEIFPFGHVFRAGSKLRVWIEAPTTLPELWAFTPYPTQAVNTILHDAAHPSAIVLPIVPNDPAIRPALPPADCGDVIRQPCRTDTQAAPSDPPPSAPDATVPEFPVPAGAAAAMAVAVILGARRRTIRA